MSSISTFSRLKAECITPTFAWEEAEKRLTQDYRWVFVLALALRMDPSLHPRLYTIASKGKIDVFEAFKQAKLFLKTADLRDSILTIAVWAAQTKYEECSFEKLIEHSSLAWTWSLAQGLMPATNNSLVYNKEILMYCFNMARSNYESTIESNVDMSIFSNG